MRKERRCRGVKADGTPCRARSSLVNEKSGFCFSHDPARKEKLSEAGRKGAEALHKKYARKGLDESELPPLTSPEVAEIWLERIAKAVATGRMPHQDARAATSALQQWLKAHEVGKLADTLETLRGQLESVKATQ